MQHYLWVELFGYHLHPKIPTEGPQLKIADVGTGTGYVRCHTSSSVELCDLVMWYAALTLGSIWLTDLEKRLPKSVGLDGLDISFDATPPPQWLPANVTLHHWDLRQDPPEALICAYDIVHIRNFALVLMDNEIQDTLKRLAKIISMPVPLWSTKRSSSVRITI